MPSLIGHLASVDIKQHERKESICERERIQLTDIESSVSFCVQFIICLKWRIQIVF